jgi:hypothetical protein
MTYATIEEAWGLKTLGRDPDATMTKPVKKKSLKYFRPPSAFVSETPHKPVPTVRDVQKFIAGLYAKTGAKGVIQLLGPQISQAICGKAADAKSWLSSLLEDPEKMLIILAALFGLIVLLDVTKPVEPSLAPW